MIDSKAQSWKTILIVIIFILGGIIFYETLPFLSGVLGACTVYILVRKQMFYFTEVKRIKPVFAATLILIEVTLCFLIPMLLALWLLINRISSINFETSTLVGTIQHFIALVQQKTSYDIVSSDNITTLTTWLTTLAQKLINQVSSFLINCFVLLFFLYFLLLGAKKIESYLYDILPFSSKNKKKVVTEIKVMIKSNAIGIPLLAVIQGVIAMIGYLIFGTPDPVLFGFLTCFATILPLVGTALIWFPLSLYLFLTGNVVGGIGLAIYSLVIVSNADNVVRFWLQKKMADTHPLITIFGVVIGLKLFGFWGVIFGPLMLSIFLLCFDLFKKDYID